MDVIRVGESVASVRNKLVLWKAESASNRFAWSRALSSDKPILAEQDQLESKARAQDSFYDDPIFAWHTGEAECVICFTGKSEVVTRMSQVKSRGNWKHGLTMVRRDGHVE